MREFFSRTELLFGEEAMQKLKKARVAVFGLGGVGGYTAEALARSGIGALDLIDNDTVSSTNINRQIYALTDTVGHFKVDVAKERILKINPEIKVNAIKLFYLPEDDGGLNFSEYDYVVDAVDTVAAKLAVAKKAYTDGTPAISAMGAGNKLDPTRFEVADIYETTVCPLARVMRRELKKCGVPALKVVYSKEKPVIPRHTQENAEYTDDCTQKKAPVPGSTAFVPAVCGLIVAGEVVRDIAFK